MALIDMMKRQEPNLATHDLREKIAEAIFNDRYECFALDGGSKRDWQWSKHNDQWLAVGCWYAAGAVMKVLPIETVQFSAETEARHCEEGAKAAKRLRGSA